MSVEIRPLRQNERTEWDALWTAYLDFYKTSVPMQTYDTTWSRLHDPAEPMGLLGAYVDGNLKRHRALSLSPLVLDDRQLLLSAGFVRGGSGARARARACGSRRCTRRRARMARAACTG